MANLKALTMLDPEAVVREMRALCEAMKSAGLDVAVVGGFACILHNHCRTTEDVDLLLLAGRPEQAASVLEQSGFHFDPARRTFRGHRFDVDLVRPDDLRFEPQSFVSIEGLKTLSLSDLIAAKIASAESDPRRYHKDFGDVVALIEQNRLDKRFVSHLPKPLRSTYKRLVDQIRKTT